MTDRALLEAAARAAGIRLHHWCRLSGEFVQVNEDTDDDGPIWNPLTDYGDRYQLAKACDLRIDFLIRRVLTKDGRTFDWTTTGQGDDEAHAIVRAAAMSKEER